MARIVPNSPPGASWVSFLRLATGFCTRVVSPIIFRHRIPLGKDEVQGSLAAARPHSRFHEDRSCRVCAIVRLSLRSGGCGGEQRVPRLWPFVAVPRVKRAPPRKGPENLPRHPETVNGVPLIERAGTSIFPSIVAGGALERLVVADPARHHRR